MKEIKDIIAISKQYGKEFKDANDRRQLWNQSVKGIVKSTLDEIASKIIENEIFFASNLYVEDEDNTLSLTSGKVRIPGRKDLEDGFSIHFWLLPNGKLKVTTWGHSRTENAESIDNIVVSDLKTVDRDLIIEIIYNGIEKAIKTSYFFLG